jgi:hypothetical protein
MKVRGGSPRARVPATGGEVATQMVDGDGSPVISSGGQVVDEERHDEAIQMVGTT